MIIAASCHSCFKCYKLIQFI